jgi:hypothetical protein
MYSHQDDDSKDNFLLDPAAGQLVEDLDRNGRPRRYTLRPLDPLAWRPAEHHLLAPPTEEEERAFREADAAERAVREHMARRQAEYCPQVGTCGQIVRIFHQTADPSKGIVGKFKCKKLRCPYCARRRELRHLSRALQVLLYQPTDDGGHRARTGSLYTATVPLAEWDTVSRSLRRHGGGYARFVLPDDTVAVLAEKPFRGAAALTPSEAVRQASIWIRHPALVRGALRWLGTWAGAKPDVRWTMVPTRMALEAVVDEAIGRGALVRGIAKIPGYAWRFESEAAALQFLDAVAHCPDWDMVDFHSLSPNPDTDPWPDPPARRPEPPGYWWDADEDGGPGP